MSEEPKMIRPGQAPGLYYFPSRSDKKMDLPCRIFLFLQCCKWMQYFWCSERFAEGPKHLLQPLSLPIFLLFFPDNLGPIAFL